jgi:hypothetical protein
MIESLTDEPTTSKLVTGTIEYIEGSTTQQHRPWTSRPFLFALSIWMALIVGVSARIILQKPGAQTVLPIYLAAGERWLDSDALYPAVSGHDLYRNPPGVAVLFIPFTWLPTKLAEIVWRICCLIPYLFGIWGLIRYGLPPLSEWRRAWLWVFAAVLVLPAFNNGQINVLIVASALCGVTACVCQRWWIAAGWLSFAGWLKVYPLAIGLLCILVVPRKLIWRFLITTTLMAGLPFLLQNPVYVWDRHLEFWNELKLDDRTSQEVPLSRVPRDWTIVPRLWGDFVLRRTATQGIDNVVALGMASLVAYSQLRTRRLTSWLQPDFVSPLCLGLVWITLFGPSTEMNTYSMLAPVAGLLAVGSRVKWISLCGWIGGILMLAGIVRASFRSDGPYPLMEIQAIAAFVLLIAAIGQAYIQRSGRPLTRWLAPSSALAWSSPGPSSSRPTLGVEPGMVQQPDSRRCREGMLEQHRPDCKRSAPRAC